LLCGALALGFAVPLGAAEPAAADSLAAETRAEVPALSAFHEVIYPLWHEAWPASDTAMMKKLLPDVRRHVEAVRQAELPGILRDRREAWEKGIAALEVTLEKYERAAAADEGQGLRDAVEELHSRFESLVRIVRPRSQELDAYHVALYRIYHHHTPRKAIDPLRSDASELAEKCEALGAAPAPRRLAARADDWKREVESLCARTAELVAAARGDAWDAVQTAVEAVHTQYRKLESLCE
jgi:hypothetical protein